MRPPSGCSPRLGVRFAGGCAIERVDAAGAGRVVRTSTHGDMPADVVLVAAGVEATLPPALGGGRTVDTDGRMAVPGADGVWACGDVAAFPHPRYGRIAIPHWDNARAERRTRRRRGPGLRRALRPRPVLVLGHRPAAHPAGRLRPRRLRVVAA